MEEDKHFEKISSDEEGVSSKMIYGGEKSLRSDKMNVDNNSFNEAKKFNPPNIFEPQNSSNNPPTLINQTWDEEELHDDEEEDNEYLLDESLNGISNSLFWTQSISPGKYYNRARGGGQTATPALLSLQRQFATCIIETIQKGIETQPKSDPPTNLSCTKTCSANCSKHIAGNENNSDKEGSDNSSSFSTSSNTNSKISRNNFDSSSNYSPVKKRRRKRRRYQMKSFVRDEIIRKRTHPAALHPDVGFNEPGQLNDGPQCKCSWAAKQTGVRHGKFAGEQPIPLCFSVFFHKPLPERFPQRPINQWTQQFQVRFLHENTPESFTIADLELFHKFLFEQVLELYDLNRQINTFKDDNNLFCPFYHCLPRFARTLPDNGKELLPLSSILSHFIGNFVPLVDDRLANYFIQNPLALVDFASQKKGEICLNPKKKPLSIRLDLLEQSLDVKEFYPVITHFGIKPNAYAFLARPQMQEALYKHLQLRKHLTSKSTLTFEEKWMLRKSEAHLNSLKREWYLFNLILISFLKVNQNVIQLFMLVQDHAKNVLNNCGLRIGLNNNLKNNSSLSSSSSQKNFLSEEILQKQQQQLLLIQKTGRRRGINVLMEIMAMQRCNKIKENNGVNNCGGGQIIRHNERLEFLGDAVVEFLATIHLFFLFTELDEGGLATFRSALVQNRHLATLGDCLGLQHFMVYAHGPDLCHSTDLRHAMANTFEALMAAVFLDSGLEECDKIFANTLFENEQNLLSIWTNLPEHPLKRNTPFGDRHLISSVPCLKLLAEFENCIGIKFKHIRLLAKAFTRRNVPYNFLTLGHNQRLEFLGDTILQLLTSEYLYKHFPYHQEGHLSLLRTCLVQATTQAVVCDDLAMTKYLVIPPALLRKCPQPNLRTKDKADLVEAFLGALYVDRGLLYCRHFCRVCFFPRLKYFILSQRWNDPKSQLQQSCLTLRDPDSSEPDIPEYKTIGIEGPTNTRVYTVAVYFRNKRLAVGTGASMHLAQMQAAENALIENAHLFQLNGYNNNNDNNNVVNENKTNEGNNLNNNFSSNNRKRRRQQQNFQYFNNNNNIYKLNNNIFDNQKYFKKEENKIQFFTQPTITTTKPFNKNNTIINKTTNNNLLTKTTTTKIQTKSIFFPSLPPINVANIQQQQNSYSQLLLPPPPPPILTPQISLDSAALNEQQEKEEDILLPPPPPPPKIL